MSIELPETKILAEQMNKELQGKRIKSYHLKDYERMQKIGFLNKDIESFKQLVDGKVESVMFRGTAIRMKLNKGVNLLLNPEYGGKIIYHPSTTAITEKFHLRIDFADNTALTVRITSMGGIFVLKDNELSQSYIYKRDFNPEMLSPIDEEFTNERFSTLVANKNRVLKSVLVGKEAVIVGLGNSAFQDILFRARLHPKKKASELDRDERSALYEAIMRLLQERAQLNGKTQFFDLYGNSGSYTPAMGPNMKQQNCSVCGTPIEKLSHGGGHVYICPTCQV